jgi:spermidine synthase
MLSKDRYDLISMEITSIWFAGAAMLYGSDFYSLVREHLGPAGVFQQWVQLHHLSPESLLAILVTFHRAFPQTYLYFRGNQGILIGCVSACPLSPANDARIQDQPGLRPLLPPGGVRELQKDLLLDPAATERLLAREATRRTGLDEYVSTDDNLLLEYDTPKGNSLGAGASLRDNLAFLRKGREANGPDGSRSSKEAPLPEPGAPPAKEGEVDSSLGLLPPK